MNTKPALRAAIKACGHNQQTLAIKLGVTRFSINKWLNDPERQVPRWHWDAVKEIAGRK